MIGAILDSMDSFLAHVLPVALRVAVWGVVTGAASMAIYTVCSPQKRLKDLKSQTAALRKEISSYDGDFPGAMRLARRNLGLSLQRFGYSLGPALLSSAPVVIVIFWMAARLDAGLPESGETVEVVVEPEGTQVAWEPSNSATRAQEEAAWKLRWPAPTEEVRLIGPRGEELVRFPLERPQQRFEPASWASSLVAAVGWDVLPAESSVASVRLSLPSREMIPVGPAWLRSWWLFYILPACAAALGVKYALGAS